MNKKTTENNESELIGITKLLLKGKTISEIAEIMNYSQSTVSNRLSTLFQKYKAKNRFEFIYNFFSKIIQNYKVKLEFTNLENESLKKNINEIKNIIQNSEKKPVSFYKTYSNGMNETDF